MTDQAQRNPRDVRESDFPADSDIQTRARFLLEYAILAPSSHNSQPWEFAIEGDTIEVFVDHSRWLEIADPDKRELYFSVGCSIENLRIAADYFDLPPAVEYTVPAVDPKIARLTLDDGDELEYTDELFPSIPHRETNHNLFEDRRLDDSLRDRLIETAESEAVDVFFVDGEAKTAIASLQTRADEQQFDDPEYRKELGYWIGTGALGSGWLKARIGQLAVSYLDLGPSEGKKNSQLIESAPVLGVVSTPSNDRESQVKAGQAFQRLALRATADGVALHPMNQILQVPALKAELLDTLDARADSVQLLFRIGYADPDETDTPRRPVETVLRG